MGIDAGMDNKEIEEFFSDFEEKCGEQNIVIPNNAMGEEWFTDAISLAKDMGYGEGYVDGRGEERMSRD